MVMCVACSTQRAAESSLLKDQVCCDCAAVFGFLLPPCLCHGECRTNQYFQNLLNYDWEKYTGPGGHWQWKPQHKAGKQSSEELPQIMMLTSDVALLKDPSYLHWVQVYANDTQAFAKDFGQAWYKLMTRSMGPVTRCLGDNVPPPQASALSHPNTAVVLASAWAQFRQAVDYLYFCTEYMPVSTYGLCLPQTACSSFALTTLLCCLQAFQLPLPPPSGRQPNWDLVRSDIVYALNSNTKRGTSALAPDSNAGRSYLGAQFAALAWQCASTYRATDFAGGCNGARIRFEPQKSFWPGNAQLVDAVMAKLQPIKSAHPDLTWADLIVLAGTVAVEQAGGGIGSSSSGGVFKFCSGRTDASNADGTAHLAPRSYISADIAFRDNSVVQGLTGREAVVLAARPRRYGTGRG